MLVTDQAKLIRLPIDFRHLLEDGFENHAGYSISGRTSSGVSISRSRRANASSAV